MAVRGVGFIRPKAGIVTLSVLSVVFLTFSGVGDRASGAGFFNAIQSAGAASVSTAGQTAAAEDAATVFYNPAGMVLLKRPEILAAVPIIALSNSFQDGGTSAPAGGPSIGAGGNKDIVFTLPSLFATLPVSDRFSIGLGLFVPFGQANDYDDKWVGRYQLTNIAVQTLDIDPVVGYRLTDNLSIGAGLDIQYTHLKRKNAIDFGAVCFGILSAPTCAGAGLLPQTADGAIQVKGDSWNVGFNVSLLYALGDATHLGLNYRSTVRHNFSGNAEFEVPIAATPLLASGLFQNTGVRGSVTFPQMIDFGLSQALDDRFIILADIDWTGWSRLTQTTLTFGNPLQPPQTLSYNWRDSWRFAIGGAYHLDADTDLRAGVSFDDSPVPSAMRGADLPDSDGTMYSAGVRHRFDDRLSVTASYSYGTHASAPADFTMPQAGTLVGRFKRTSNAVGVDVRVQL